VPRRIAVDLTALRESRDFRLLIGGEALSGLGMQAALVALPFQIYLLTRSAALVGLLGIVELGSRARSPRACASCGATARSWAPSRSTSSR
jgi:hypothetical protein